MHDASENDILWTVFFFLIRVSPKSWTGFDLTLYTVLCQQTDKSNWKGSGLSRRWRCFIAIRYVWNTRRIDIKSDNCIRISKKYLHVSGMSVCVSCKECWQDPVSFWGSLGAFFLGHLVGFFVVHVVYLRSLTTTWTPPSNTQTDCLRTLQHGCISWQLSVNEINKELIVEIYFCCCYA